MRLKLFTISFAFAVAGCGGGTDSFSQGATTTTTASTTTTTAAAASSTTPLVVSAANPSGVNGTLDKTLVLFQNESGSSNSTGTYQSSGPNDHCRVALYQMTNSGDTKKYMIEVTFSKTTKAIGIVNFAEDSPGATYKTTATGPLSSVTIDIANRQIVFTNTALTGASSAAATLNGSLEYSTNAVPADQAVCG